MISKLFFRLYLLVVITLVGVGWSLDQVFEAISEKNYEPDTYAAIFTLVDKQLSTIPEEAWAATIQNLRAELRIPMALEPVSSIVSNNGDMETEWSESEIIIFADEDGETLLHQINASMYALSIGPVGRSSGSLDIEFFLNGVFYISLAIAIMLWVRPLWVSLRSLSEVTSRFGKGEFDVRASVAQKSAVAPLAETFNSMAGRIQRLIESHKELTNAVSHDLRTPLARMRFGIDMLGASPDEQDKQRYMASMQADIDELDALINEMLTYATFERDRPDLTMQSTKITPWLEKIVARTRSINTNIEITCVQTKLDVERQMSMEPSYMARALTNLISNATRFATQKIQVEAVEEKAQLNIYVDDDGPGIPEADRKKIFEAFQKSGGSDAKNRTGFGLGLAIVHRIVVWHGGQVDVTSSPLGGARFHIKLPMQAAAPLSISPQKGHRQTVADTSNSKDVTSKRSISKTEPG
ncbi:MAG: ATP-binding protein [Thiohalomonadales bacterium]